MNNRKNEDRDIDKIIWNETNRKAYLESIKASNQEEDCYANTHKYFLIDPPFSTIKQAEAILSCTIGYKMNAIDQEALVEMLTAFEKPAFRMVMMSETAPRSGEFKEVVVDLIEEIKKRKDEALLKRLELYL